MKCHYKIIVEGEKAAERQQIEFAVWGQNNILKCSATKCPEKTQKLPKHACCLSQKMNINFKLDIRKSSHVVSAANFMKILLMFADCITSTQVY